MIREKIPLSILHQYCVNPQGSLSYLNKLNQYFDITQHLYTQDEEIIDHAKGAEVIIGDIILAPSSGKREVLEKLHEGGTKFYIGAVTGEELIDIEAATQNGIAYASIPDYSSTSAAELSLCYLIMLARKVPSAIHAFANGLYVVDPSNPEQEFLKGIDLKALTIGLFGFGNIGRYTSKLLNDFGCNILVTDHKPVSQSDEQRWRVNEVSFDELVTRSQAIVICASLNEDSRGIFNKYVFEKMKGTLLVNVARGQLVNASDLYDALLNGNVKQAALDVHDFSDPGTNKLLELGPGKIFHTPHFGFYTENAAINLASIITNTATLYARGQIHKVPSVLNPQVLGVKSQL